MVQRRRDSHSESRRVPAARPAAGRECTHECDYAGQEQQLVALAAMRVELFRQTCTSHNKIVKASCESALDIRVVQTHV
jgi:hypothetical protein